MCLYVMDSQTVVKTLILNPPQQNNPTFKDKSSLTQQNVIKFTSDDTEISIFDAHKYFNDVKPDHSFRGTPTPSSEASWNSKTGLLPNPPPKNISAYSNHSNRWLSSAKKWFFRCCNGEKSVQVKEVKSESEQYKSVVLISTEKTSETIVEIHHIKAMAFSAIDAPRQQRISASGRSFMDGAVGFTFPILNSASNHINSVGDGLRLANYEMENPSMCIACDDDFGSEASSDLFEIESFSTQTTSYQDSADDQHEIEQSVEGGRESVCSGLRPRREEAEGGVEPQVTVKEPLMFSLQAGGGRPPQAYTMPLGSSCSGRFARLENRPDTPSSMGFRKTQDRH